MARGYGEIGVAPFRLTPDPAFFYASETHRRALTYLDYGLQEGEGFVVLTGAVGTGKSTVIAYLLGRLDLQQVLVARLSSSQLDDHELLGSIARALTLAPTRDDKAYLLDLIGRFIAERRVAQQKVLLIVDEAQCLPRVALEELRMLTNTGPSGEPGPQCFLVGQSDLRVTIEQPELEQLRQRVIAWCHLEPLSVAETSRYINHRLSVAGWRGQPRLSDGLMPMIHAATDGVPRRINILLGRLLMLGALEKREVLEESDCREVVEDLRVEQVVASPKTIGRSPQVSSHAAEIAAISARIGTIEAALIELLDTLTGYEPRDGDQFGYSNEKERAN